MSSEDELDVIQTPMARQPMVLSLPRKPAAPAPPREPARADPVYVRGDAYYTLLRGLDTIGPPLTNGTVARFFDATMGLEFLLGGAMYRYHDVVNIARLMLMFSVVQWPMVLMLIAGGIVNSRALLSVKLSACVLFGFACFIVMFFTQWSIRILMIVLGAML